MKQSQFKKTLFLTQISVLSALLILFGLTKLGYIQAGVVEITINVIPVAVGAIVLGPLAGTILGAVFGLTSFWQCFGMSAFGVALMNYSPFFAAVVCIVPRVLVGLFTGLIYRGLSKKVKNITFSCGAASLACPILNTILFMGAFVLFYSNSAYLNELYGSTGASNVIAFIAALVGVNGIIEAVVCFIVATSASRALIKMNKKLS